VRKDPPELLRGDYVEALRAPLADRQEGPQLVVFQTASTMYLEPGGIEQVREALQHASEREPLVYLGTGDHDDGYALEVERYPGGKRERLAVFDFHGAWLEWGR